MAKLKIMIPLELTEKQLEDILANVEGGGDPAVKLAVFTQEVISQIIKGAMIMPADAVDKIREINPNLENPDNLVEAIEQINGVSNGEMVIRWPIDPALTRPLQDRAEMNGLTVQDLIKNMMDEAVAMGWFYDLSSNLRSLFLTQEQVKAVQEATGLEDFVIDDIVRKLVSNAETIQKLTAVEDDELNLDDLEEDKIETPVVKA